MRAAYLGQATVCSVLALCASLALAEDSQPHHGTKKHPHRDVVHHDRASLRHGHKTAPGRAVETVKHQGAGAKSAPAAAAAEPVEAIEAVEAVEPVEAVEAVEATGATPASDASAALPGAAASQKEGATAPQITSFANSASQAIGHMHAAVVHLPIAWVLLWLMFDVLGLWCGQPQLLSAGPWLGALATLSFVPAVVSGLWRFDELAHAAADAHTMDPALVHRNLMWLALGACALTYLARRKTMKAPSKAMRVAYCVLLFACFACVGFSAHLGGQLVYGDDFLPF